MQVGLGLNLLLLHNDQFLCDLHLKNSSLQLFKVVLGDCITMKKNSQAHKSQCVALFV